MRLVLFLFLGATALWAATPTQTQAAFYADSYAGKLMASGRPYDPAKFTCASWDFPLGTKLTLTCGGNSVLVTVTDRGPAQRLYQAGRRLDLSRAAFEALAPARRGIITVTVTPR